MANCLCCRHHVPTEGRRICPIPGCERVFRGNGWDGIDAHWRARHENIMCYEEFWASLCERHRLNKLSPNSISSKSEISSWNGMNSQQMPSMVVAADWSVDDKKRWMARGVWQDGCYAVHEPENVGDVRTLLKRLRSQAPLGTVIVGFDFPIGLPRAYAERRNISSFREALYEFDSKFFVLTDDPSLRQPFYPCSPGKKGEHSKSRLVEKLGVSAFSNLLRKCDRATNDRGPAECLFFTCGGKQVGRGAIIGWRDVITPTLHDLCLWPFDGTYEQLLARNEIMIVEIYPAEAYRHLGFRMGRAGQSKTTREGRQAVARHLINAQSDRIRIIPAARLLIESGFGAEDDFDAMVSLLSMLQVVTGRRSAEVPDDEAVRKIEGWIFGQKEADV